MWKEIGSEDREKIAKSCERLLFVRLQYARIAFIYSDKRIGRKDVVASAERLQIMIDDVIAAATHYIDTGEDGSRIQRMTEDAMTCALSLLKVLQPSGRNDIVTNGIHPDDWAWIENVKAEEKSI